MKKTEITISALKAHLSEVLSKVRKGEVFSILDRKTPFAQLTSINTKSLVIRSQPKGKFTLPKSLNLKIEQDVVELLLDDRRRR